jgi:uncharacterized protein (TIGR03435 family)
MGRWRLLSFTMCFLAAHAQAPLQFDAATVKQLVPPYGPGSYFMKGGPGTADPGRVTIQKAMLIRLLTKAFHVEYSNVTGPDWIRNRGPSYTFTATMPTNTSQHDFDLMFQRFLTEQFKLVLHHEPRLFPAYELVMAPGGPKLKTSDDQSDPTGPDQHFGLPESDSEGFAILGPGRGSTIGSGPKGMHLVFQQYSMSEFAAELDSFVTPPGDRTHYVVDKTGLAGRFDIRLRFDNRDTVIKAGPGVQEALRAQDALGPGSGLPTVFKAVEQQLGLRLVKTKDILVDTLVVDHAEQMPVGN